MSAEHFRGCHPEHDQDRRETPDGYQPQETENCWHCGTPTEHGCNCAHHKAIMGGLSMAELKMQAAGGVLGLFPGDTLPYSEDDPVWAEHAYAGLARALAACKSLLDAISAAVDEVAKLRSADHA